MSIVLNILFSYVYGICEQFMPIQYIVVIITVVVMGIATFAKCYLICCFKKESI